MNSNSNKMKINNIKAMLLALVLLCSTGFMLQAQCDADLNDITAGMLEVIVIDNFCDPSTNTLSGGEINAPAVPCPVLSTLMFSLDGFVTVGSAEIPAYDEVSSLEISTRCVCDNDMAVTSPTSTVATSPVTCCGIENVIMASTCHLDGTFSLEICFDLTDPSNSDSNVDVSVGDFNFTNLEVTDGCVTIENSSLIGNEETGVVVSVSNNTDSADCTSTPDPVVYIAESFNGSGATDECSEDGEYVTICATEGCSSCPEILTDLSGWEIEDAATNDGSPETSIVISSGSLSPGECLTIYSFVLATDGTTSVNGSENSSFEIGSDRLSSTSDCRIWNNGSDDIFLYDGDSQSGATLVDSESYSTSEVVTYDEPDAPDCPDVMISTCMGVTTFDEPSCCTLPEVTLTATCTNKETGTEADQDNYYVAIIINSKGSDTDGNNEVTVTVDGVAASYATTGTYYVGPFTHSGTGTTVLQASYTNAGESCEQGVVISEVLCGYLVDSDGQSDGTADDDLHASGAACDCTTSDGLLLAQVAPGSFNAATSTMFYILEDASGNVSTFNNTGLFLGLSNQAYTVHSYNVDNAELAAFTTAIPAAGAPYAGFTPPADACLAGCGSALLSLDCTCRVDDVALVKRIIPSGPYAVGDKVTFSITVFNQGTNDVFNVSVADYLPAGLDFYAADNTATDFAGQPDTFGGGTVTTTVANPTPIPAGGSYELLIVLELNANAMNGNDLVNTAEITGATEDEGGSISITDEDDNLDDTGGGAGEDDDNIDDDMADALTDQDDFDMALLSRCDFILASIEPVTVCKGTTSAPITASVSSGTFVHILLAYNDEAQAVGFENVWSLGLLGFTGESFVIPDDVPAGTYSGSATLVSNDICLVTVPFSISVTCPDCGTFPWDGSK